MKSELLSVIQTSLFNALNCPVNISKITPVSGGSINNTFLLETNQGRFFVKTNSETDLPGIFKTEEKGLILLKKQSDFFVPRVIFSGTCKEHNFLILEFMENETPNRDFWSVFGQNLAKMHQQTHVRFGLNYDNYIGSLKQSNKQQGDWASFFVEERLEKMLILARNSAKVTPEITGKFSRLFSRLDKIYPDEPPALLHGDLWSGNFLAGPKGTPCIIDPAVYYGHREMDIAMTRLFGGFGKEMYLSYHQAYPLAEDWQSRTEVCNLYPLLVHLNLFGGSYLNQITSILKKWV